MRNAYTLPHTPEQAAQLYGVSVDMVERFADGFRLQLGSDKSDYDWPSIAGVPFFELDALPVFAAYVENNELELPNRELVMMAREAYRIIAAATREKCSRKGNGRHRDWLRHQAKALGAAHKKNDAKSFVRIWFDIEEAVGHELRHRASVDNAWFRDDPVTLAYVSNIPSSNSEKFAWFEGLPAHMDLAAMLAALTDFMANPGKRGRASQPKHACAVAVLCMHRERLTGCVGYSHNDGKLEIANWPIKAFADPLLQFYGVDPVSKYSVAKRRGALPQ